MSCLAEFASWLRLCPVWDNCSEKKSELQRQKTDVGRCWGAAELIVPASGFHELLSYSKLMCLVNTLFKKITVPPFIFRWIMYHAHSQTISHWIPPITCSGRCDFFLYYRWENWGSGKYSHFAHSLLAQIPNCLIPKPVLFLTTSVCSQKRTSVILMKAALNLSICFLGLWQHPWGQAFRKMGVLKAHQTSKLPLVLKG